MAKSITVTVGILEAIIGVSLNIQFPSALETVPPGKGKKEGWWGAGLGTELPWGAAPSTDTFQFHRAEHVPIAMEPRQRVTSPRRGLATVGAGPWPTPAGQGPTACWEGWGLEARGWSLWLLIPSEASPSWELAQPGRVWEATAH